MTLDVDVDALQTWNRMNARARQAYRVQQGLEALPGGMNYRPDGLHGRPMREWLLDTLADLELAECRVRLVELIAEITSKELGLALNEIERMRRGEVGEGSVRRVRAQDQGHGVQGHRSVLGHV